MWIPHRNQFLQDEDDNNPEPYPVYTPRPTQRQTQSTKADSNLHLPVYNFDACHRDFKYADLPDNDPRIAQHTRVNRVGWNDGSNHLRRCLLVNPSGSGALHSELIQLTGAIK